MSDFSERVTKLPAEQEAIRAQRFHPTGTVVEFKEEEIEQSIPSRFEKIVAIYGGHLAVEAKDGSFSYQRLNEAANRIAWALLKHHGKRHRPVAVLVEHGAGTAAAILGILKAGGFYVPLDPSFPTSRLDYILGDSKATLMLTDRQSLPTAEKLCRKNVKLLNINALDRDLRTENPLLSLSPTRLASILYTSGSTGQPKGVVQNHRNVLHLVMRYTNFYRIRDSDRIALLRSFSVSGGTLHTFGALLNGATLLPFDLKQEGVASLARWLRETDVAMCSLAPRTLRHLATFTGSERLHNLRRLTLSGEPLYRGDIDLCRKYFSPDCILVNSLGATEAPLAAQYVIGKGTTIESSLIPVGYASRDMELLLLDDNGSGVRNGEVGEIAVKSRYLALGYWRSRELTRQKFLPNPRAADERTYLTGDLGRFLPDGSLLHLGRKDDQVKIRGYRVGVNEVELALLEHPRVKEAAIAAWESEAHDKYLAAYIVGGTEPAPTASELLAFLRTRLPDYMVPAAFVFLKSLPQINGKVDRLALPRPERIRPNLDVRYTAASNEFERQLVPIWEDILDVRPIGVRDNFFDLGGHSLAASQLVSQVIRRFQVEVPIQSLFEAPTVAEMAAVITEHQAKKLDEQALSRMLAEVEQLTDEEARRLLADETGTDRIGHGHE